LGACGSLTQSHFVRHYRAAMKSLSCTSATCCDPFWIIFRTKFLPTLANVDIYKQDDQADDLCRVCCLTAVANQGKKGLSIMPANRIFTQPGQSTAANSAGSLSAREGAPAVVFVVADAAQQAAWQFIYRMAEERARKALEPPRHHQRLFSVWN
jgi:hypothetical protein